MPISPSRKTAYEILRRVENGREFAVNLLQRPEVSALNDADRRLATEIIMGALRWRGETDFQIERLSGKSVSRLDAEVLAILRMSVYQLRFLERVPKRAVVNDAVELTKAVRKRSAAGFVNAVLRKCEAPNARVLQNRFEDLSVENRASVRRAYPEWLLSRWKTITATTTEPGEEGALRLAYAGLATPQTTLRVTDPGASLDDVRQELDKEGVTTSYCEYAEAHGLKVESGQVQNSRAYREGRVAIQDEASQLVAELVAPEPGQRILDLCAAPGMKSAQLAQMLGTGALIACDRSTERLRVLKKLLPRRVPERVRLSMVRLDAARELPIATKFDRILLDAPCSGTGTLARNPEIKWRLRPEDIMRLANMQARMLRHALPLLAKDGQLVYATCSLEPEENESVVEKVLSELPGFRMLTARELSLRHPRLVPLFDSRGYFWTRPDQHSMDGFNAAVIVRQGRE
jgi:16S rRNA (cytosine967-C5)-methyltransferase